MSSFVDALKAVAKFAGDVINSVCGWVQDAAEAYPTTVGTIIIVVSLALLIRYVLS